MLGSIVEVNDGSWSVVVREGELRVTGRLQDKRYIVLAIDCDLPTLSEGFPNKRNDTVIQEIVSKDVIFIQKRFLDTVYKCPKCGKSF